MSTCPVCDVITQKKNLVYEDEKVCAFLPNNPVVPGHLLVTSKQHTPILEQVPDFVIDQLFIKANKLSIALFESFGAEGTNMIIPNGPAAGQVFPHVLLHVIPRKINDNLPFLWQPKKASEEELTAIEEKLKEQTGSVGQFEREPKKPVEIAPPTELPKETETGESYLIKQLRRIP